MGRADPLARLGRFSWRRPLDGARTGLITVVALATIVIGLGASIGAVALIARGVGSATITGDAAAAVGANGHVVTESMKIVSGTSGATAGWPKFTNSSWTVHEGDTVVLKITSFDDGTAPLTGEQMMYDKVMGTTPSGESIDGTLRHSVPDVDIAHTFTIVGLGLNLPIPVAPSGKSVTVEARFVASRAGTWMWQCYAPCGSGAGSEGGAMSVTGWMSGTVRVVA